MTEYRLLATSMMVGDNREIRAHRGDMVEVEDARANDLIQHGLLCKKGDETDAQKKEFEAKDASSPDSDAKAIAEQEKALQQQGGAKDNKTQEPNKQNMVPTGAPATSDQANKSKS